MNTVKSPVGQFMVTIGVVVFLAAIAGVTAYYVTGSLVVDMLVAAVIGFVGGLAATMRLVDGFIL